VTKAEVDRLGLNHLIGTSLMRAYMHGYFVDNRLWHKARALAEPFAYDTYRQQRVQQKMEQERKSRIAIVKKLPKVRMKMFYPLLHMRCQETPKVRTNMFHPYLQMHCQEATQGQNANVISTCLYIIACVYA